jgi:hypothetical protein
MDAKATAGTSKPTPSMPWWCAKGMSRPWTRGTSVFLTNASVQHPLQPFDDDDAHSLIENGCIKACTQQWALGHRPHFATFRRVDS